MITLQAETLRLVDHFLRAENIVATRPAEHLDEVQSLVRQLLLQEVGHYRSQQSFPKNHDSEEMRPTFIDAQGTPCAMAHLLQVGGASALADRISRERNHQFVPQLASDPEFAAWLSAAGLSVEEAATIQPSYGCTTPAGCVCGEGFLQQGVVPAKAVLKAEIEGTNTARIQAVYGQTQWKVGDVVTVASGQVGTKVLIGIGDNEQTNTGSSSGYAFDTLQLSGAEQYTCAGQGVTGSAKAISPETYAAAVMAPNCKAKLIELEPSYAGNPCFGNTGCSTTPASASVGILLALVGVLLARRLR